MEARRLMAGEWDRLEWPEVRGGRAELDVAAAVLSWREGDGEGEREEREEAWRERETRGEEAVDD